MYVKEATASLDDTLEPLAVGAGFPPTLELTDVLDEAGIVSSLVVEDMLSPASTLIDETLRNMPSTSSNTTRTVAVNDLLKPQRQDILHRQTNYSSSE